MENANSKQISERRQKLEQDCAHIRKHENPIYLNMTKNNE